MGERGNRDPDGMTGDNQDEMVDGAKQEEEKEASEKREETTRLIARIVRSTVAAAKKAEEDTGAQNKTLMNQGTMAAGKPHEPIAESHGVEGTGCDGNGNQD